MEQVFVFLDEIGAAVCHRLPERSFFWGGRQMPLCARCTGLYTGAFFASCFFFWKGRQKGEKPFSMAAMLLTACALLPIAADGFCSYIGLWESSQFLRVLTGAAAGAATPGLFLLAGNFDPVQEPVRPIYENTKELPALLAAALLWGLALWLGRLCRRLAWPAFGREWGMSCFMGCFHERACHSGGCLRDWQRLFYGYCGLCSSCIRREENNECINGNGKTGKRGGSRFGDIAFTP